MDYTSTRAASTVSFSTVVASGLAPGGGLFMPKRLPKLDAEKLACIRGGDYATALAVVGELFSDAAVPPGLWEKLARQTVGSFRHPAVAPLAEIGRRRWLLELFHGPTLSFKDYGLQPLARLLSQLAARDDRPLFILGATSGDTGSAGLAAFANAPNASVAILHPHGRVSEVQRRQMTTVTGPHIRNIAIDGSFDDCQRIAKTLLAERAARNAERVLSVNSINWGRLLFQCAYHVYTAARLSRDGEPVALAVPSGNFGNALSAIFAAMMGAPIGHLVVATNANDKLARALEEGVTHPGEVTETLSPAMDIQIPSNLERLVYLATGGDAPATAEIMAAAAGGDVLRMPEGWRAHLPLTIEAHAIDDAETRATIRRVYEATDRIVDPHTAVGVAALERSAQAAAMKSVAVATAHPAKFPEAVESALGFRPPAPPPLAAVMEAEERMIRCEARVEAVRALCPQCPAND